MSGADNVGETLRGLRILLVEDDPLICLDLETSLEEFGAIVTAASSVAASSRTSCWILRCGVRGAGDCDA